MHATRLERLDPSGLHWLLTCDGCSWRVVVDDSGFDNDGNYVLLAIEHTATAGGMWADGGESLRRAPGGAADPVRPRA